jgi:hypothetical protein
MACGSYHSSEQEECFARDVSSKPNTVVDPKDASEAESNVDSLADTGVATNAEGNLNSDSLKMPHFLVFELFPQLPLD